MSYLKRTVLLSAAGLFILWLSVNFGRITAGDETGLVRVVLGSLYALIILFRTKLSSDPEYDAGAPTITAAVGGALMAVLGLVFQVHQFQWLGFVLLLYGCLRWSLPARAARDVRWAMFLLYWVHPLPGQLFGGFQLAMQQASVWLSEWLLHTLNVRVWADGFFLRTGGQTFGVPESCSGMRTAVAVALCMLGSGMSFRFRWFETLAFILLGLVHVLALNVVRIVGMVIMARRVGHEWAQTFLHDSLGSFLMLALLLTQVEAVWYRKAMLFRRRRADGIASGELERPDRGTILPSFWRAALRWGRVVVPVVLTALLLAALLYKRRPAHRAEMIAGAVEGIMINDLDSAERAVDEAIALAPQRRDLRSRKAHIRIMRGRYPEGLADIMGLGPDLSPFETALKSRALMGVGRTDEAIALIDALPAGSRQLPGVAILRAEYAALRGDPAAVSENIEIASRSMVEIHRVRALFPYLALHEQWKAIARSDRDAPYRELAWALIAVHAQIRVRDFAAAAVALRRALKDWPADARFLSSLSALAIRQPGGEWERHFADTLVESLDLLNADRLALYVEHCFQMNRPDLAWLAYAQLARLDPRDPFLFLAPAQYGDIWFNMRRHHIGVRGPTPYARLDVSPFFTLTEHVSPFAALWRRVPLAGEVAGQSAATHRGRFLKQCLDEMARREQEGSLSRRMELNYPTALAMAGRYEEAHKRLDDIEKRYPDLGENVHFLHAAFYDQESRWHESYEALRAYQVRVDQPGLTAEMLLVNALMHMNLGILAMDAAERAGKAFPGTSQPGAAMAAIWNFFGFKEHALFLLERQPQDQNWRVIAQLQYETGRFADADRTSRAVGLEAPRDPALRRDRLLPLPADAMLHAQWPPPLSLPEMADKLRDLEQGLPTVKSPLIRRLAELEIAWYRGGGAEAVSKPELWRAGFRDGLEMAASLHRLAVLQARQGRLTEARGALQQALVALPTSPVLRRLQVGLAGDDPAVIMDAYRACPEDPELWLASLVVRSAQEPDEANLVRDIRQAAENRRFPIETFIRAGDYLLRRRKLEAARWAARHAVEQSGSLITGHVLALRIAVTRQDYNGALIAALNGIDRALDPAPFYATVVRLKDIRRSRDADYIKSLEYLQRRFPKTVEWGELLGQAYFEKGDPRRALNVLSLVLEGDVGGLKIRSLLLASESARLEGDAQKAVNILEMAYAMYPDELRVLNNLVYSLLQDPNTVARARELLPALLERGRDNFAVLDTAAMVYLRSGQIELARQFMERAMARLEDDNYASPEVTLNSAEVLYQLRDFDNARRRVELLRRNPDRSPFVDRQAIEMIRRIDEALRQATP